MFGKLSWLPACAVVIVGCSTVPQAATSTPAPTRYRVGDFIVYKYAGNFSSDAVLLSEDIVAQEGNRLTIVVQAKRGDESRKWEQVVTDTPENQKAEKIDELYDLSGGGRVRLANESNKDVYRLYDWTIPPIDSRPVSVESTSEALVIGNTAFTCSVENGKFAPDGHIQEFHFATCPDFLWVNGPARVIASNDEVLWERQIVEFGRR
ncbi:MAG: hypothetical protein IT382_10500 [Deltaproteobacteria bacterium]|nr:hypothetical protein [Deltaproteobacteria bacterium]